MNFDELLPVEKRASTVHQESSRIKTLISFFGDVPLCSINLDMILQYRKERAAEVGLATVNLGVSFLRYLLNMAADHGVLDSVPRIKLPSEKDREQQRSVELDEYRLILASLNHPHQRKQQRCIVGWWETGFRHQELFDLTWPMVDFRAGLLRLPAEVLKERSPRRTPISYELRIILEELKTEQSKVGNITGHVFTRKDGRPIKNINRALDLALRRAKLLDDKTPKVQKITPHSFRRAAITRWTDLGIPRDVVMAVSGHSPSNVHDGYIRLTDQMLVDHFRSKGLLLSPSERKTAAVG